MEETPVRRKEIWLVKIPKESHFKIRPILILSNNEYNKENDEVVGALITYDTNKDYTNEIVQTDFEKYRITEPCAVRYDGLIKIDKKLLHKRIAKVSEKFRRHVISSLIGFLD